MTWCRSGWLAALVLVLALAGAAAAQQGPIEVEVIVAHVTDTPGGIDPRGERLHRKLQREFRYQSLDVVQTRRLRLLTDQVGTVDLPNGRQARIRPLQLDVSSVLLAVEVEGAVKTDLRVKKGHLVVIGAERHADGKLVISLKPRW